MKQINLLIVILLVSCSGLNANELRDSISLNNEWLFHTDPENKGMGESWFSPLKNSSDWESVQIPSNWNTLNRQFCHIFRQYLLILQGLHFWQR